MKELKENETGRQPDELSVEVIRKCVSNFNNIDNSWDHNISCTLDSKNAEINKTPPYEAMLIDESVTENSNRREVSVQTEPNENNKDSIDNVFYSLNAENQLDGCLNDNSEHSLGGKRIRRDSFEDRSQIRPYKKGKCTSSVNDISIVVSRASSESETSFKSIKSNYSYKVRKKRRKSDSNLFRDVLQRSKKTPNLIKNGNEYTPGPVAGTPRSTRRSNRTKVGRLMEICTWIGKKGYQSLTGLYSDILREPTNHYEAEENLKKKEENTKNELEEVKTEMKKFFEEVNLKHSHLVKENEFLQKEIKRMASKIEELEIKISQQQCQPKPQCAPPPPPPPPPPPQPAKLTRAHTLPRSSSSQQRASARLTITPEDIANVKLRKTKDNPVRPKPTQKEKQPFISQHLLEATRAKLGRNRPVAASTPKQQLSELEKCLLQETSVTTLYRRRVTRGSCRSADELRTRPYPAARSCRSPCSPKSPRSNSMSRVPGSPLKFPLVLPP